MEKTEGEVAECQSCLRNHGEDQPCPERLALTYVASGDLFCIEAQGKLTNADREWMRKNAHFSVYAAVKRAILETLR